MRILRPLAMVLIVGALLVFSGDQPSATFCGIEVLTQTYWIKVCDANGCYETGHSKSDIVDKECPPGGGGPPGGPSPPPPPGPDDPDQDNDGIIDCWKSVIETLPQHYELSVDDRLGSSYGGPNILDPCHTGIDINCLVGDSVKAAYAGQVVVAEESQEGGKTVRVESADGFYTDYLHLNNYAVSAGDWVAPGDPIGGCGQTGTGASGPHLHFRVMRPLTPAPPAQGCEPIGDWQIYDPEGPEAGMDDC